MRHKLLFSTILAVRTLAAQKRVAPAELPALVAPQRSTAARLVLSWVPADAWERAAALADAAPPIAKVLDNLRVNRAQWAAWPAAGDHEAAALPTQKLVPFTALRKLLLVRTFHPHRARDALR
jgi:hypothetical protein